MKKIFFLFITLFFLMNLIGCSDECYLAIDSLSADGNEFYCNQKVKLWMCVKSSDLWHTDYRWSCDGELHRTARLGRNDMAGSGNTEVYTLLNVR